MFFHLLHLDKVVDCHDSRRASNQSINKTNLSEYLQRRLVNLNILKNISTTQSITNKYFKQKCTYPLTKHP